MVESPVLLLWTLAKHSPEGQGEDFQTQWGGGRGRGDWTMCLNLLFGSGDEIFTVMVCLVCIAEIPGAQPRR